MVGDDRGPRSQTSTSLALLLYTARSEISLTSLTGDARTTAQRPTVEAQGNRVHFPRLSRIRGVGLMRVIRVWYAFSSTCEADLLTRKEAIFSKSLDARGCHVSQVTHVWQKQLPVQLS